MIFGLSTFGVYIYLMSHFDVITISEAKNYLIILPILFVLAMLEFYGEIKFGIKKSFVIIKKLTLKTYRRTRLAILNKKLAKGKQLTEKQKQWIRKIKGDK